MRGGGSHATWSAVKLQLARSGQDYHNSKRFETTLCSKDIV
jgi:hypothetical protein